MQKQKVNIKESVMKKIHEDKISMKPKRLFFIGSVITFLGLVASVVSSVFLISIISFLLKSHGPMGEYRLWIMINSFPWWIPVLAVLGVIAGIILLKKYDVSYKKNYWFIILVFILAIILAGIIIDASGINRLWLDRGPMRGMMRQYIQDTNNYDKFELPNAPRNGGRGRFLN